jgi:hypothetical protein
VNATHQLAAPATRLAAHSQKVTDLSARIGWVVGLALFVALLYWLMRQGWKWRGTLQGDLPPLPTAPEPAAAAGPATHADGPGGLAGPLTATGRYHGSTIAGQWLERVVAHGLGTRSRATLTLTGQGLSVERPGDQDFFIPARRLRGASLEKGIAGKVLTEGGLLVITWEHGERLLDSGFRCDHAAVHPEWVERVTALAAGTAPDSTTSTATSTLTSSAGPGAGGVSGGQQPPRTTEKGTS